MAATLTVTTRSESDAYVCVLSGSVDSYNADKFESVPKDAFLSGAKKLIFDVAAVQYIASAGLRIFAMAMKSFPGKVIFAGMTPYVQQTFRMNGFDKYATMTPTVADALQA